MKKRSLGCFNLTAVIAVAFTLALLSVVYMFWGNTIFSPGKLNPAENGLQRGGIWSHAELNQDCSSCHPAPWSSEGMSHKCRDCHAEIAEELGNPNTLHGMIITQNTSISCKQCHSDHDGVDTISTVFNQKYQFVHEVVGFSLTSHHRRSFGRNFVCADCHSEWGGSGEPVSCTSCHEQEQPEKMALHMVTYSADCLECHDGIETYGSEFDHAANGFPLEGKHAAAACEGCHATMSSKVALQTTPNTCAACHKQEDAHSGRMGEECGVCHSPTGWEEVVFDHSFTGFSLEGLHNDLACDDCHLEQNYQDASSECVGCHLDDDIHLASFGEDCSLCHSAQGWIPVIFNHATAKAVDCIGCHTANAPSNHFPGQCSACHDTAAWLPANFSHTAATVADCKECHSVDKPINHYSGQCSACHSTTAWKPATFSHSTAGATDCKGCHTAQKPNNHWGGQCSACHSTTAWKPATFDHKIAGATDCQDCHSGNKPNNHWGGQCSACHSTTAWKPATFNHKTAGATNCKDCHSGDQPNNHFAGQCLACHNTKAWKPASFNHQAAGATNCKDCHSGDKPNNHFDGQCSACHSTNDWKPANFNHQAAGATKCKSCHTGDKPNNHWGGQCSACHGTKAWKPASFNHQAAGATDCKSCHSGDKPNNHFVGQCSQCHSTNNWDNATFDHTFPLNHEGADGKCSTCHPNNYQTYTCYGCHEHSANKVNKDHDEVNNFSNNCVACHADGKEHDD